ncbi:chemotaxis protein CheD [Spirochaeta cellobiosiphila]|uniref:chemotaxis protein CheD n=1 Tax=Spirochaeta cellobiosiphila TaxID=504483 RepID=UPI0003FB1B00|nr:chemotaxis protein CheD [Spirochaeta cellobiosiphila]
MKRIDIGIGDLNISKDSDTVLKTYALGSCVAIVIYEPIHRIAGMVHVALPDSGINKAKSESKPGYFVDTGVPLLLDMMSKSGALKNKLIIKLIGGASVLDDKGTFDIGKRNYLAAKKILWKYGLGAIAEDVGGSISRTVAITTDDGELTISNARKTWRI